MKAQWFGVIFIAAVLIMGATAWPDIHVWLVQHKLGQQKKQTAGYDRAAVQFSEVTVQASVPLTAALQQQGLGGRTGLGPNEGMLFLFDQPERYPFWMKDMVIPIDFIWIAENRIVDLTANVPPPDIGQTELPVYRPSQQVTDILEVSAGFAAGHNIKVGDVVRIDRR